MRLYQTLKTSRQIDIASDGLRYDSGHTNLVFKDDPESPITFPVMGVCTRVPAGEAEGGRIRTMNLCEGHAPVKQKIQAIVAPVQRCSADTF